MYTHMFVYIMYVCVCTYIYIYIYVYIYIYMYNEAFPESGAFASVAQATEEDLNICMYICIHV